MNLPPLHIAASSFVRETTDGPAAPRPPPRGPAVPDAPRGEYGAPPTSPPAPSGQPGDALRLRTGAKVALPAADAAILSALDRAGGGGSGADVEVIDALVRAGMIARKSLEDLRSIRAERLGRERALAERPALVAACRKAEEALEGIGGWWRHIFAPAVHAENQRRLDAARRALAASDEFLGYRPYLRIEALAAEEASWRMSRHGALRVTAAGEQLVAWLQRGFVVGDVREFENRLARARNRASRHAEDVYAVTGCRGEHAAAILTLAARSGCDRAALDLCFRTLHDDTDPIDDVAAAILATTCVARGLQIETMRERYLLTCRDTEQCGSVASALLTCLMSEHPTRGDIGAVYRAVYDPTPRCGDVAAAILVREVVAHGASLPELITMFTALSEEAGLGDVASAVLVATSRRSGTSLPEAAILARERYDAAERGGPVGAALLASGALGLHDSRQDLAIAAIAGAATDDDAEARRSSPTRSRRSADGFRYAFGARGLGFYRGGTKLF